MKICIIIFNDFYMNRTLHRVKWRMLWKMSFQIVKQKSLWFIEYSFHCIFIQTLNAQFKYPQIYLIVFDVLNHSPNHPNLLVSAWLNTRMQLRLRNVWNTLCRSILFIFFWNCGQNVSNTISTEVKLTRQV